VLVLREAVLIIIAGVVIGISAAALLGSSLSRVLYGISPYDATSFAIGPIFVVVVALVACVMPARRAMSIDPLRAMRAE
jgi:ABC-type antimicrobial peptide transport system permease subunit